MIHRLGKPRSTPKHVCGEGVKGLGGVPPASTFAGSSSHRDHGDDEGLEPSSPSVLAAQGRQGGPWAWPGGAADSVLCPEGEGRPSTEHRPSVFGEPQGVFNPRVQSLRSDGLCPGPCLTPARSVGLVKSAPVSEPQLPDLYVGLQGCGGDSRGARKAHGTMGGLQMCPVGGQHYCYENSRAQRGTTACPRPHQGTQQAPGGRGLGAGNGGLLPHGWARRNFSAPSPVSLPPRHAAQTPNLKARRGLSSWPSMAQSRPEPKPVPALCGSLGERLGLSEPRFPHLLNGLLGHVAED